MIRINKFLRKHYKLLICLTFIIISSFIIVKRTNKVNANDEELTLASKAFLFYNDGDEDESSLTNDFKSGQASGVTPSGKTIFMFFSQQNGVGKINGTLSSMAIYKYDMEEVVLQQLYL